MISVTIECFLMFQAPVVLSNCAKMCSLIYNLLLNIYFDWPFSPPIPCLILFVENLLGLQGLYSPSMTASPSSYGLNSPHSLPTVTSRWKDFPNVSPNVRHSLKMPDLASQRKLANIYFYTSATSSVLHFTALLNI